MKRTPLRKKGKSSVSKLEKICDDMMTPLAKKLYPLCECGCGKPTEVGHHWIEKSRSKLLRHDKRNIVGLTNTCHLKIHNIFGNNVVGSLSVAEKVIKKRGKKWAETMKSLQPKTIQYNAIWLETKKEELQEMLL